MLMQVINAQVVGNCMVCSPAAKIVYSTGMVGKSPLLMVQFLQRCQYRPLQEKSAKRCITPLPILSHAQQKTMMAGALSYHCIMHICMPAQLRALHRNAAYASRQVPCIPGQEAKKTCLGLRYCHGLQGDINDWLVAFCYFAGDTLWFVAVCFQMIEALNPGYDARVFEWQEAGCKVPKPRYPHRSSLTL